LLFCRSRSRDRRERPDRREEGQRKGRAGSEKENNSNRELDKKKKLELANEWSDSGDEEAVKKVADTDVWSALDDGNWLINNNNNNYNSIVSIQVKAEKVHY